MKEREIETIINNYYSNSALNLTASFKCLDVAFDNVGTTDVTITTIGTGGSVTLLAGDPMMTFEGCDNFFRADNLRFSFAGGIGSLIVYVTRIKD